MCGEKSILNITRRKFLRSDILSLSLTALCVIRRLEIYERYREYENAAFSEMESFVHTIHAYI